MRTSFKILSTLSICSLFFQPSVFAEPAASEKFLFQSGVNNAWQQFQDVIHDTQDKVHQVVDDLTDTFNTFNHPAFPEYTMRYKTPSLCDPNVKQISGYLDVDNDKHFFFWFFESRNKPKEDPLVLWLNGGPGCSSLTGLFMELGPCTVNKAGDDTTINPYSWNSNSSIVFLDQPLNVGYSYGEGGASDTKVAAKHVYAFLQLFFKNFKQYADLDFHVAGESYAGHYIPRIGTEINKNNQGKHSSSLLYSMQSTLSPINLKSLMIGNGLTDPLIQYKYYSKMACENSYGPVLDSSTCRQMDDAYPACARLIESCYKSGSVFSCLPAAMKCNKDQISPYQQTGMNPYDVREKCKGGNLCYEILESVQKYLNRDEVKKAVGAKVEQYESCNMQINFRFSLAGDWMRPYVNDVPPLLEDGIRILIYAGDADFICNWMGNKAWSLELPWSGGEEFKNVAKDEKWISALDQTSQFGELRSTKDGKFAFLRVFGAGHMVPYDQPEASLQMLNTWVHNKL